MTIPFVTAKIAAVLILMLVALSILVIRQRRKEGVALGDNGGDALRCRIRAHGNFVEYAPIALIALLLLELSGTPSWQIWALGGLLILGRLLHAVAIYKANLNLRVAGMACTFTMLIFCAIGLLIIG